MLQLLTIQIFFDKTVTSTKIENREQIKPQVPNRVPRTRLKRPVPKDMKNQVE